MSKPVYLIVTSDFPSPTTWRGAFNYDFVRVLERTGKYRVEVFVPNGGFDYDYQGVHVHGFRRWRLPSGLLPFLFVTWNEKFFLKKLAQCGIDLDEAAVCHAHTSLLAPYARVVKRRNSCCRAVVHHHSPGGFGLWLKRLGMVWLNRFLTYFPLVRCLGEMDLHVFVSSMTEKSIRLAPRTDWTNYRSYRCAGRGVSFLPPVKVNAGYVLHNGVDRELFHPNGRTPHEGFVVGCVANFIDLKNQMTLLEAVDTVKDCLGDWRLRFIGSGPTLARCRRYVRRRGLERFVSFEREMDHTELPDFYRSLDLFVLPSYFEAFGCVFTEAWSCGTPFITCEGQGMDDLILPEDRALWLCRMRDPDDLAAKILHYHRSRPKQTLGKAIEINGLVSRFLEENGL